MKRMFVVLIVALWFPIVVRAQEPIQARLDRIESRLAALEQKLAAPLPSLTIPSVDPVCVNGVCQLPVTSRIGVLNGTGFCANGQCGVPQRVGFFGRFRR